MEKLISMLERLKKWDLHLYQEDLCYYQYHLYKVIKSIDVKNSVYIVSPRTSNTTLILTYFLILVFHLCVKVSLQISHHAWGHRRSDNAIIVLLE